MMLTSSQKERSESDPSRDSLEKPARKDFFIDLRSVRARANMRKTHKNKCFLQFFVSRHFFERTGPLERKAFERSQKSPFWGTQNRSKSDQNRSKNDRDRSSEPLARHLERSRGSFEHLNALPETILARSSRLGALPGAILARSRRARVRAAPEVLSANSYSDITRLLNYFITI